MFSELKESNLQQQKTINALIEKGRFIWGFPRVLEAEYSQQLRKKIIQRIPMVGLTSICFLILFAVLDQFMLPSQLAYTTAFVRILVVCPVIFVVCLWLYIKPPKFYLVLYSIAFLFVSLSAVWVIWFAHREGALLPYEGLMITIMYGFVILGLPLSLACLLNAIVLCAYIFTEPFYILSFNTYVNNVMFLSAMYLAGFVSALILSHSQRNQFLQQVLLNLSEERARFDLEAKNRYLAVASHDLRQPLQAINMMTDHMCEQSNDENLHKLKSAAHALRHMFDQLLDSSKINLDLMKIEHEAVDLIRILKESVTSFTLAYEANHIELILFEEHENQPQTQYVWGDYAAIQRIINNLLQNALVHSGASRVTVSTRAYDQFVDLVIKDNGRGILEADKQHAFEEFMQLDTPNKDQGLGVGLSIVDKLSKAMGFKLCLKSENGCEFIISIPVCNEHPVDDREILQGPSILVVEDDRELAMQYENWFKNWHWNCEVVNTLKAAKASLNDKPDWVITDWNLPDGSGKNVLEWIDDLKNLHSEYDPNILVISSNTHLQAILPENCRYLSKPVTASRLRALLEGFER